VSAFHSYSTNHTNPKLNLTSEMPIKFAYSGAGSPNGNGVSNNAKVVSNPLVSIASGTEPPEKLSKQSSGFQIDGGEWNSARDFNGRRGNSRAGTAIRSVAPSLAGRNALPPRGGLRSTMAASWRSKDPQTSVAASRVGPNPNGSAVPSRAGTATSTYISPYHFSNNNYKKFLPGQVFWAPFIVPNLNPSALETDEDIVQTINTGPWNAKFRPMIALAKFIDHMVCLPMFTHQGNGWENKKRMEKENAFYVRSFTDKSSYWDLIDPAKILITDHEVKKGAVTYADKPHVVEYTYQLKLIGGGRLQTASFDRLVNAHNKLMKEGQDFNAQDERLRVQTAKPY